MWFDNPLAAVNWMIANQDRLRTSVINYDTWRELERKIIYFAIERSIEIKIENLLSLGFANSIDKLLREIVYGIWDAIDQKLFEDYKDFISNSEIQLFALQNLLQFLKRICCNNTPQNSL